jgi:hypothetical protein
MIGEARPEVRRRRGIEYPKMMVSNQGDDSDNARGAGGIYFFPPFGRLFSLRSTSKQIKNEAISIFSSSTTSTGLEEPSSPPLV